MSRYDIAIINRSFWPVYPVIGEALLRLAEQLSHTSKVCVIMQDHADIRARLHEAGRGGQATFFPAWAGSSSASGLMRRAFDTVFFMLWVSLVLLWTRPRCVYVSTDPPVLVPFVVAVYARLSGAQYTYHLQDIHPEAANVVVNVAPWLSRLLVWIDGFTMRHASTLVTLTEQMKTVIMARSFSRAPITLLNNPAVPFDEVNRISSRRAGFSFCGNAGRLQRMPLLIAAIDSYLSEGGCLHFVFAGGGVYAGELMALAHKHERFEYRGQVPSREAARIVNEYDWALLPIEDAVTRFAFPSKVSTYAFSGARMVAICGGETSVATWVLQNKAGVVVTPNVDEVVAFFRAVEHQKMDFEIDQSMAERLREELTMDRFVIRLEAIVMGGA